MDKISKPPMIEVAGQNNGRDITQPYIQKLVENQDEILSARGGGNLGIYAELLTDDQVFSTFQQRRLSLIGRDWGVTPASDAPEDQSAADFIKDMLTALDFDSVTEKAMYGAFFGYSVAEIMWGVDGNKWVIDRFITRDRSRFRYGKGGELYLLTIDNPLGELMPENKFWTFSTGATHDDAPYGMGLAHYLYWPVFFKRNGMKFWLKFLEKFGIPTIMAKAPSASIQDDKTKKAILEGLRSIQQDAAVLVPDNIDLEFIQANAAGATSHEDLSRRMDKAIAKIVLSQTMTSDGEGGQYKGDMQKGVRDEVIRADSDLICGNLNRTIIKQLTAVNFPTAQAPKVWRDVETKEDINKRVERDEKIYQMGYEPTEEYIEDTYGEGWVKRVTPEPAAPEANIPGPDFSELNEALVAAKMGNRSDQEAIAEAARNFASDYQGVIGNRMEQLTAMLEETNDLATFREQVTELMAEAPPPEMLQSIERATFFSRLLGAFRSQR